jgi:dolichol-phosphate mannosyltransferase
MSKRPTLSVVVPLYNEEENAPHLIRAVSDALKGHDYELVLVDDGSSDATIESVEKAADKHTVLVKLATNFGQTSAIAAGIDNAHGDYIVTLDGDLQNDPADIPAMLEKLKNEKLDVVMGIRQKRQDGMFLRKIPSKIANKLIRRMTGVQASDYGCTLKIFRRQIAKQLDLYGELHRFIPILSTIKGAKIAEMPVRHHARRFGTSKYGLNRTLKVMSDLLLMLFFMRYRQRPMHLFGSIGLSMFGIGGLIALYLMLEKLLGHDIGQRPIFYVGILLIIMSVQFITAGFLAELIMRTYFESQQKKPYIIAHIEHYGEAAPKD